MLSDITGVSHIFSVYKVQVNQNSSFQKLTQKGTQRSQRTNSMVRYETTLGDLEAGTGGVYQTTVEAVPVKSSKSWIWKTVAAVAFLGLCITAALFFAWHTATSNADPKKAYLTDFTGKPLTTTSGQGIILKQIAENTKAAIHLHGQVDESSLKWVSGVDQSFAQGGLKLIENGIRIPADGLYFVYSQVSYAIGCKDDDNSAAQNSISHIILRDSDAVGKPMALQSSVHSVCQTQEDGKTVYSTIYLGAAFQLLEGDKLSTETTHVADIEENYAKTFFGVFAL